MRGGAVLRRGRDGVEERRKEGEEGAEGGRERDVAGVMAS